VRLFDRHTRGVDLTAAGELFLERAGSALVAADAARRIGSDLEAGVLGTVRLGLSTALSWRSASPPLEAFALNRPGVEVNMVESYGGALARDLRDGRLDAVLAP
jgi:DNA-binding transcriptional LysR family regulator